MGAPVARVADIPDLAGFAELAVRNIHTEFPHAAAHVVRHLDDPARPKILHPAFHGSFDWHSCVHMHWLLVRLLTEHPSAIDTATVVSTIDSNLTGPALRGEAWYLRENPSFERPYGWAWLMSLAAACAVCPHPAAATWAANLTPLVDAVEESAVGWLARAAGPVCHGTHRNTAFALALVLDAAEVLDRDRFESASRRQALAWFAADRDYPAAWEPSGEDFLSPALCEADLMRRVLPAADFPGWLGAFLPGLATRDPANLFAPPSIVDSTDALQGHLFGLNLSRAAQFRSLAASLPAADSRVPVLLGAADELLAAGLPAVRGGGFGHEHWLATFAYWALP